MKKSFMFILTAVLSLGALTAVNASEEPTKPYPIEESSCPGCPKPNDCRNCK